MNRLPYLERAEIPERKLSEYLLSRSHPLGQTKARYFLSLGFHSDSPETLRVALLLHASTHPVVAHEETGYGSKYVVDGPLESPSGKAAQVRSVWFVESGESVVRFVTAYPERRR